MLKNVLFASLVMLGVFVVTSCKDDDNAVPAPSGGNGQKDSADVLVMYYTVGGGNLDRVQVNDIICDIREGADEKVKMTFQYKLSASLQKQCEGKAYHGVFRMNLDDNKKLVGDNSLTIQEGVLAALDKMVVENYSQNPALKMGSEEEIAAFINWSMAQQPARKHVLVVADHGGGWDSTDAMAEAQTPAYTRTMSSDDNTDRSDPITSRMLTNAIRRSNLPDGRLDGLVCDCCLMAQWENIAEYAQVIDYLLASVEQSVGYEHYYLLKAFKKHTTDMPSALRYEVDATIDLLNQLMPHFEKKPITDFSFYDLNKTGLMLQKIAALKDELIRHWDGGADSVAINGAIVTALVPDNVNLGISVDVYNRVTEGLSDEVDLSGVFQQGNQMMVDAFTLLQIYVRGTGTEADQEALYQAFHKTPPTVCLGSFFHQLEQGLKDETFTRLYNDFYTALKDFAHMRMTQQEDLDPYVSVSPSVTFSSQPAYAMWIYQQSTFDKATGWSDWLNKSSYFPSFLTNRFRRNL